jgi:hypothetical protein
MMWKREETEGKNVLVKSDILMVPVTVLPDTVAGGLLVIREVTIGVTKIGVICPLANVLRLTETVSPPKHLHIVSSHNREALLRN